MSSSEVGAPTSDSSVTEEVKEASAESATKPAKDDNSSEASPKKVTSNSTTTAMEQNGEDRPTSPTEEAGLKNTQAQTETDCNKDEEYTSSEAKHNGVDEDNEKSEKETEGVVGDGEEGGADGSGVAEEDESGGEASAASGGGGGGASPSKPAGSSQHNTSIVSGTSEASSLAAPAEASGMGALEGANGTGSSDEAGKTAVTSADGLTVDDLEDVLLELNKYEKQSSVEIPSLLESYLKFVAKSGSTHFPWNKIKRLFRDKLEQVFNEFFEASPIDEIPPTPNVDIFNFANVKDKVFEQLESFAGIPFTIQRIAELLTTPKRHYRRTDKFMRALEKNMLVVSHTEPRYPAKEDESTKLGGMAPFMNGEHSTETTAKLNTGSPKARRSSSGGVPILVRSGSVNAKRDLPMTSSLAAAERTAAWASQASAVNSDAAADTSGGSTDCSRSSPAGTGGTAGLSEEEKERLEGSQISTSTTEEEKQTSDSESKLKRCDLEERESGGGGGEDNEAGTGEPAAKRGKMDSEAEKSDPDGGAGSSKTGSEEEKEVAITKANEGTPAATTSTDGDSNQSKATTSDSISSQESVGIKEESVQENGNQTSPTPSTPATGKEMAVKNGSTEDSEDKNGKSSEKEAESSVAAAAGDHSSKTAEKNEKSSDEMEVDTECSSTESGNILQVE